MNIALINPNPGGKGLNEATVAPPLGLGYIAAVLEQKGFNCSIIDANLFRFSNSTIIEQITRDTKLIGIYCNSFSYNSVKDLVREIRKKRSGAFILVGGPLPSVAPEMVLREFFCDGVIKGEGEYSVLKIAEILCENRFPFSEKISGFQYLSDDKRIVTHPVERISNLDVLPFPAYHLFPPLKLYKTRSRKKPVGTIITSRGCPFDCSFCSKDVFQRATTFRSAKNVLSEIGFLVKEFKVKQIDIMDDNFAQNRPRLLEILDGLIKRRNGVAINLQSGIRIEALDEDVLRKMKKAGVYKIAFGIESADSNVLKLHNKKLDLIRLEEIVTLAKKLGFVTYGFFIIGLPGETDESFEKTLALAKRLDFDAANFMLAIPFVGTELYKMIEKKGRFLIDTRRNIDVGFYHGDVFFEYDDCNAKTIKNRYCRAYREFYTFAKRLKILFKIRSIYELFWLIDAAVFVIRGIGDNFLKSKACGNRD